MRTSVIISTYNAPDWLEKVVWGYAAQSYRQFDLIVADDGSTEETARRIDRLRARTGLTIQHVWHEDRGFGKCAILNKAIECSTADYLVFSDGDCIARWDFVETHVALARPGSFLSGGAVRLPMALSKSITIDDVMNRRATDLGWLVARGLSRRVGWFKLAGGEKLSRFFDVLSTTRATWNGGNASAWRADILRVNGYDERMGHGGLDRELGERLVHAGVRPRQVRHRAVCVHLDHARGYARADVLERNLAIRRETRRGHLIWTAHGIRKAPNDHGREAA